MRYRLALRLGEKSTQSPPKSGHEGAIGWAVIKLPAPRMESSGTGAWPDLQSLLHTPIELLTGKPAEERIVDVVEYDDPADMLGAMSIVEWEIRLQQILDALPANTRINRVKFDRNRYKQFLLITKLEDSHEARAQWAAERAQEIDRSGQR